MEKKKNQLLFGVFYDQYFIAFHKTSNFLRVFKDNARIQCNVLFLGEIAICSPFFFQAGKLDIKKKNSQNQEQNFDIINYIFSSRLNFIEKEGWKSPDELASPIRESVVRTYAGQDMKKDIHPAT